jgi:hypothetical protein
MKISNKKIKKQHTVWSFALSVRHQLRLLCLLFLLVGCSSTPSDLTTSSAPLATPTLHPYLTGGNAEVNDEPEGDSSGPPTVSNIFQVQEIPTPVPIVTTPPFPTRVATATAAPNPFTNDLIYNEELNINWALNESWGVDFDPVDPSTVYTGTVAISVIPNEDFPALFFTVREDSDLDYFRDDVLGITFRLNSGSEILALEDMAVSVVGSNENFFWLEGDESVEAVPGTESTFSETRLNFLGISRAIPPETWVEVTVWLDDLEFDPVYTYITGFYIKTGDGYRDTYYIDNVALIYPKE